MYNGVLFIRFNVGIDSDTWHHAVVSETGGKFLKDGGPMHGAGNRHGYPDAVQIGIDKIDLRPPRRYRLVDDADGQTHLIRLGRHVD